MNKKRVWEAGATYDASANTSLTRLVLSGALVIRPVFSAVVISAHISGE